MRSYLLYSVCSLVMTFNVFIFVVPMNLKKYSQKELAEMMPLFYLKVTLQLSSTLQH